MTKSKSNENSNLYSLPHLPICSGHPGSDCRNSLLTMSYGFRVGVLFIRAIGTHFMHWWRETVLHEGKLKPAGFKLLAKGIEICFGGRKIYFTNNVAYEGDKRYICSTYGLLKSI